MTDAVVTDLLRELSKVRDALAATEIHLARHAEANAALHCAERVMYSPLHAKVTNAIAGIDHALARTQQPAETGSEAAATNLLADLDRCEHGRHAADPCISCPDGQSTGNRRLEPGQQVGNDLRGDGIYVPHPNDKRDPAAWRRQPGTEETP